MNNEPCHRCKGKRFIMVYDYGRDGMAAYRPRPCPNCNPKGTSLLDAVRAAKKENDDATERP